MDSELEIQRYEKHMPKGEDLTLIVLKGHLLIEEKLERIIWTMVAHGELLEVDRLTFAQKTAMARAMCWARHDSVMWNLLALINRVRNECAHQLDYPDLRPVLSKIKECMNRERAEQGPVFSQRLREGENSAQHEVREAILAALGFLAQYEKDALAHRHRAQELYSSMEQV